MRIDELHDRIVQLERAAHQNLRRELEAQAVTWFTHAGVETLLEIIQLACLTAFPDAVGFLCQQMEAYPPVGGDPDLEAFNKFWAKKQVATKCKTKGEN
jgi:hypothetical protein